MKNPSDQKYTYFVPDEDPVSNGGETDYNPSDNDLPNTPEQRIIKKNIENNLWLSVSEASKLGGVKTKTIRRAIKAKRNLKYKIVRNKYRIELRSLIVFMHSTKKLENKFYKDGLGQYVQKWRK